MKHQNLSTMIAIAEKAIELYGLEAATRMAAHDLDDAYREHKEQLGLGHVARGTPEWDAMLEATSHEYGALVRAKNLERNAKRRLATAIRAHLNGGAR